MAKLTGADMSKYKMVLCDMDGTLLKNDKSISAASLEAIDRLNEQNILFVPATGRSVFALPEEIRELSFLRYAILINGALVYDWKENRALRRADITPERACEVFGVMSRYPVTRDVYMNDTEAWMDKVFMDSLDTWILTKTSLDLISRTRQPVEDLTGFIRRRGMPVQKIQGFFRDEAIRTEVTAELRHRFPDMSISGAVPLNVELTDRNADKGICLSFLMDYLGIAPEKVIAFGDEDNDCDMLKIAGTGVAMGNASEKALACADRIAESNEEDGFAKSIFRWVL